MNKQIKQLLGDHFGNIDFNQSLVECKRLLYQDIEYCRSSIYVIAVALIDDQPIFGQVSYIVKNKEKWWLIIELLETVAYDENLFAWELKSSNRFSIFDPCELNYYHKGLDFYLVNNSTYVSFAVRLTSYE